MAEVRWTDEQLQAIESKGSNILVAAAAGSGKTAVLVERIISKVINDKVDIDKILVVTFTNAAASEMRERILEAIYKKIEENPDDSNLQKQLILLNKASICTIDSFCKDVIKNNFYEINASANFRVGDSAEIELLKQETLEDLFEEKYMAEDKGFIKLINTYTGYQRDDKLKELILKIYNFIQSNPTPIEWLNQKIEMFNSKNLQNVNFAQTVWGKILIKDACDNIFDVSLKLKKLEEDLKKYDELLKYKVLIGEDISFLESIIKNCNNWDDIYNIFNKDKNWGSWPVDRKVTLDFKDEAKIIRDDCKKKVEEIRKKYFIFDSEQAKQDIIEMYDVMSEIKNIIIEFSEKFTNKKREKNIIDFNDMEHFALDILVDFKDGKPMPTEVAKNYQQKFEEIAIDEYQDSNLVQETILNSVSKGNNVFMVGDVKQSIYQFRQARPKLFLDKYSQYGLKNENTEKGLKIQLFKNFRSRENILNVTNIIFENIMSQSLGNIKYDESEFLNLGAEYTKPQENIDYAGIAEVHIIDKKQEDKEEELETEEDVEDVVLEAKFVAKNIKKLINSNYMVFDKKQKNYRKIQYRDIAVLLRATTIPAPIYEQEITEQEIPVFTDTSSKYLDTFEIQVIMSLLKIIDNPMQDIPLITVMRSSIGGFTDNELVQIRLFDTGVSFYETLMKCQPDKNLREKVERFLREIQNWQEQEKYMSLDELIWQIYQSTGFYNYVSLMPNGALRQANLKMLFERAKQYEKASFKGLYNFINFIDKLHTSSGDLGSAKIIGESENVVRIMSIHKSKGLEFPIVYLCGTGKNFNLEDLKENIILHQDLGLGPKYINEEIKIEYPTLAKEALKIQSKIESISEEMRVLYVALTRAKEKLIITGMAKDAEKSLEEKQKNLDMYNGIVEFISDKLLKNNISYLDWIELVFLKDDNLRKNMTMNVYKKAELMKELVSNVGPENRDVQNEILENIKKIDNIEIRNFQNSMAWRYKFMNSAMLPTKTSVTKLKQMHSKNDLVQTKKDICELPKFISDNNEITPAQKGTLMHMCFQKLDERKKYEIEDIKEFVQKFVRCETITLEEAKSIDISKLYKYTTSELWNKLKKANKIYKEVPFYININSNELYNDNSNEEVLVQGVIDLYFIDENNDVFLVDYKTDFVENGEQLINRYKSQLELYKKALEKSIGKEVKKTYIYSVKLEQLIEL